MSSKPIRIMEEITTERCDQGLKVRRDVLGDDYVDRSVGKVSDFMRSF
jgi:hypothetical protein